MPPSSSQHKPSTRHFYAHAFCCFPNTFAFALPSLDITAWAPCCLLKLRKLQSNYTAYVWNTAITNFKNHTAITNLKMCGLGHFDTFRGSFFQLADGKFQIAPNFWYSACGCSPAPLSGYGPVATPAGANEVRNPNSGMAAWPEHPSRFFGCTCLIISICKWRSTQHLPTSSSPLPDPKKSHWHKCFPQEEQ